jgi:hypothetical protein
MHDDDGINTIDFSTKTVVLATGQQAAHIRKNPSAAHLKCDFALLGALGEKGDLHVITINDNPKLPEIVKLLHDQGYDPSKLVSVAPVQ